MNEFAKFVIYGVIGGLITWRITAFQRASERRRAFREQVSLLEASLSGLFITDNNLSLNNLRQSAELREACVKIREDIHWWRRRKFDGAYNRLFSYAALREMERYDPGLDGIDNMKLLETYNRDHQKGRDAIKELLACAK